MHTLRMDDRRWAAEVHSLGMNIRGATHDCGGAARTWQLRQRGASNDEVVAAAMDGTIVRLRKGVYANDGGSEVAIAAAHGGMVSCVSSLRAHGVWLLDEVANVHVDVGTNGRVHPHFRCDCVDHHERRQTVFGLASPTEALQVAWRCLSVEAYFVAFESAWRLGLLSKSKRHRVIAATPERIARWLRRARGDADSGLESLFRFRLMMMGLELESQVLIPTVGRVDFRYGRVLFEIDGRSNREGATERARDLIRDANAVTLGYLTIRLTYAMIVFRWPTVEATVLAVIDDMAFIPAK